MVYEETDRKFEQIGLLEAWISAIKLLYSRKLIKLLDSFSVLYYLQIVFKIILRGKQNQNEIVYYIHF